MKALIAALVVFGAPASAIAQNYVYPNNPYVYKPQYTPPTPQQYQMQRQIQQNTNYRIQQQTKDIYSNY